MSWKQSLRRASFRGVSFWVRDRGLKTGRTIHNHEYPKRNTNFPEDMGKATRTYTVDAYVIGEDYMSQRDALISACERVGPGSYVDKWGRSQLVVCDDCDLKETDDEGRLARFQLKFLEAGANVAPIAIAATAAQLVGAASGLASSAILNFAVRGIVGQAHASVAASVGVKISGLPVAITARVSGSVLGR